MDSSFEPIILLEVCKEQKINNVDDEVLGHDNWKFSSANTAAKEFLGSLQVETFGD